MTGAVVWITGLSGAGKSTVAGELAGMLRAQGIHPIVLDGDEVRDALRVPVTSAARRRRLAGTYGRLCLLLADQGHLVICATVSMQHATHRWNRGHLPGYTEVFLDVPLDELRRRDPKGIYRAGRDVVGVNVEAELPLAPDLTLANWNGTSSRESAVAVFGLGTRRKLW